MIANMNYNKQLPAKYVTTHLREIIKPRKGYVQETTQCQWKSNIEPSRRTYTSKTMTSKFHSQHYPKVRN